MTPTEKQKALRSNSLLWLVAMVLPGAFYLAFASTRFPWPVIIPLLFFGLMHASNGMLAKAMGKPAEDATKTPEPGA
jgi:hypothetical protein